MLARAGELAGGTNWDNVVCVPRGALAALAREARGACRMARLGEGWVGRGERGGARGGRGGAQRGEERACVEATRLTHAPLLARYLRRAARGR